MSGELVLQQSVLEAIWGSSALGALLAEHSYAGSPSKPAAYEFVEQPVASEVDSAFPYVVIGDSTSIDFDADDVSGQEHTLTLHIWDRYRGRTRCREIADALYGLLHKAQLAVSGRVSIYCYFEFSETIPDPDPKLQHMAVRYRIVTMDS